MGLASGDVLITISDGGGGSVLVPASNTQAVYGCCQSGTANQPFATRSPAALLSTFGYGPATEYAALVCLAGGTVIFNKVATQTTGSQSAVTFTGTGTSVITTTGNSLDTYYVLVKVVTGGTIGTTGIILQMSLDAGRNFSSVVALGTATTYAIPQTGITLNFGAGTLVAGDQATFQGKEPTWNTTGVQSALNAFLGSQYGLLPIGSSFLVGDLTGANCTTIQGYLDTLATGYAFTRMFGNARDASPASKWGGTGESEATWMAAIQTDYSGTTAKRFCISGGHWNMPSAFPNGGVGFRYRRPLSWAAGARQVLLPPQRHNGRVKDGSLAAIALDPVNDPLDGFVYHREDVTPGLDSLTASGSVGASRFMSSRMRPGLPGVYITNPLLMAAPGSDFSLMPYGSVMDFAAAQVHSVGQQVVNDDVRLNANGTIYENDARTIENSLKRALDATMTNAKMCSSLTVAVDRTTNVGLLKAVNVTVTIVSRGYVLTVNATLGFANPLVA
jgi:hypothetical protein